MDKITSLVEARKQFATQEACEDYLTTMRWPKGVTCPRCGSKAVTYMECRRHWQCECRYPFSVTAGTVFHKTHIDLPRWLMAVWLVCHSPKGISSKQIQRELGVTYKTAWYMTRRIRWAIQNNLVGMTVEGAVEIDEAVVKADGGQATGNVTYQAKDVLGLASRTHGNLRMVVLDRPDPPCRGTAPSLESPVGASSHLCQPRIGQVGAANNLKMHFSSPPGCPGGISVTPVPSASRAGRARRDATRRPSRLPRGAARAVPEPDHLTRPERDE